MRLGRDVGVQEGMVVDPAIIVYDGDCVFCSRSMAWIARQDVNERIRFTACTSGTGSRLMKEHGVDPSDPSTFLLVMGDKAYTRSDAMLKIVPMLDRRVQPLRVLRLAPRILRDGIYDVVARNRRRLISGECPVPSREMRARIIR